jgi:predicted RND superfamily exporter protein
MDEPLVGSPQQNYRFFYGSSASAILSLVVLFVITGYTAYTATEINEVITDLNELLPEARNSLRIVKEMCKHENFTKSWGAIC